MKAEMERRCSEEMDANGEHISSRVSATRRRMAKDVEEIFVW